MKKEKKNTKTEENTATTNLCDISSKKQRTKTKKSRLLCRRIRWKRKEWKMYKKQQKNVEIQKLKCMPKCLPVYNL